MTAEVYFELISNLAILAAVYYAFINLKGLIIMTNAELAEKLAALKAQNDKAFEEQQAALQKLRDELANAGAVSPEVEAALAELSASIQRDDDQNPDTPVGGAEGEAQA